MPSASSTRTASATPTSMVAEDDARLFVAVPLPQAAIESAGMLIEGLRSGPLGKVPRWVHVPNLHLTVRFLGETPGALVPEAVRAVEDAVRGTEAFDVVLAGAGSFPEGRRPRALWLGIERGTEELGALARAVDAAVQPLGWPPDDRAYRPHLTVARLDAARISDGAAVAEALRVAAEGWRTSFPAERVDLYRSHLRGQPRYELLLSVDLV
jgi:2'-5' RNA ligase